METIKIYSRWDGTKVILERAGNSFLEVVTAAMKDGADLRSADLRSADLRGADLSGANLSYSDLRGAELSYADLSGANLRSANLSSANLSSANLSGANLSGANLSSANLRSANLSRANLSSANLSDADLEGVPVIENIHQKVYASASQPQALDMSDWHSCETTHCRAGWVITLAGEDGKRLEEEIGPAGAATLIYLKSDPTIGRIPSFNCSNESAMEDMKRLAELEASR